MNKPKQLNGRRKNNNDDKSSKTLQLEKEVALGLWIQALGQIIELKGLSGLFLIEKDENTIGEQQILTGAWLRTIGQILEAVSVSSQINETDLRKLLQEQKIAITGDLLVSIGSAIEVAGGINVIEEGFTITPRIVP